MTGTSSQELIDSVGVMLDEGQGVFHLELFERSVISNLLLRDLVVGAFVDATQTALIDVAQDLAAGRKDVGCVFCGRNLNQHKLPRAIAVLHAQRHDPTATLCLCVCNRCYVSDKFKLMSNLLDFLKANLSPDIRRLEIHTSGQA